MQNIKPSFIFTDNMVLQRDTKIPVWGKADPGDVITAEIKDQQVSCITDAEGNWKLYLAPLSAGGPYELKITSGDTVLIYKNVMLGEVWLCSGQSNMEMPLGGWGCINNYEEEIANANYSQIRLLTVDKSASITPLDDVNTHGWKECSSENIEEFSSTAYFFGLDLFRKLNVPIGLINSSYSGTVAEAWTNEMGIKQFPEFDSVVNFQKQNNLTEEVLKRNYDIELENWFKSLGDKDAGNENSWLTTFKPSKWKVMKLPVNWENAGLPFFDGIVWFKKVITIPRKYAGKDLTLSIGAVDDVDLTYFNNYKAGSVNIWDAKRQYIIPGKYVKAGKNIITIRVLDTGAGGGIWGPANEMKITFADNSQFSLSGDWYYNIGAELKSISLPPGSPQFHNQPTVLFNAMIAPIIPFAIKGAIWYQGESNADRPMQYRQLMPSLITCWRDSWGEGNFPFIITQLANYGKTDTEPVESWWAELREAQAMTTKLDNTFIALTIDIGMADDIHPKNKQEVGRRLSLVAQEKVYNEKVISSGPVFNSMNIEGNNIRIIFDNIADGLRTKDSTYIKGFAIAGEDHKFYYADARIEGTTVVITSPKVQNPAAVRYLWADNPECNLYNSEWLPAAPFRTDNWMAADNL